ncbi:MAG: FAD-dependent monooxygenase [Myxococcales bacterium]|nr:FAD-dependent monooxygenase [Myxococcales bacterium]
MRGLDIGIIGCGTAGSAAALFLSRAGHKVTVYERVEAPRAVGAGILLQPTGQAVLRRLGLLDGVVARAAKVDQLRAQTLQRKTVFRIRYDAMPGAHQGYGLHRGVLFEHLFREVLREPVTLKLGVEVKDLQESDGGEGLWFVTSTGQRLGPHAVCVVADGARSQLRDDTQIKKSIRDYPWGALWFVGDDVAGRGGSELLQTLDSTTKMVGILPTGLGPGEGLGPPQVSLFYSIRADRVRAWRDAGLGPWLTEMRQFAPQMAAVIDQVTALDQVLFTQYKDVAMYPWHTDKVVYLGDAAHAMSPQLGQGANLALWDAMVLSDALAGSERLADGLALYSRQRRSHLGFYQYATRWLTPWFQSDWRPLGWLRDALMGPVTRLPMVERVMVKTLTGLSRGVGLGAPLGLPSAP